MSESSTKITSTKELAVEIDNIAVQIVRKATESLVTRCTRCNTIAKTALKITLLISIIIYVYTITINRL